jgi:tetratricopeptide (TPR) repeat protein
MGFLSAFVALSVLQTGTTGIKPKQTTPNVSSVIDAAIYNRLSGQADVWFKDGDYPKIIQLLRMQAEMFPNDYETWSNLGWMLENIDEDAKASATYKEYAKRNPKDPDAILPEAQRLFMARKYKEAIAIAEPALSPKAHPNLWRITANSYERSGQFAKSAAIWKRYLKLNPNDEPAKNRLRTVESKAAGG